MLYCYENTPRSFATGVGDVSLTQSGIVKKSNCFRRPITRILVLSGLMGKEI